MQKRSHGCNFTNTFMWVLCRLNVAANGVAYLPQEARPGIIPRLLQEILSTRIMVKAAMKGTPAGQKVLQRVMNARQFGLKLIANVTYGYTSAGFSGRMPMAEIADSIVQVCPTSCPLYSLTAVSNISCSPFASLASTRD